MNYKYRIEDLKKNLKSLEDLVSFINIEKSLEDISLTHCFN